MRDAIHPIVCLAALIPALVLPEVAAAQSSPSAYTSGTRYDAMGRVTGTIAPDPDGTGPLKYAAVRNTYDGVGNLIKIEQGELSAWRSETVAPSSWSTAFTAFVTRETTYNARGQKLTDLVKGANGVTVSLTQYSYDGYGRLQCTAVRMNTAAYGSLPASACTLGTEGTLGPDRITKNIYDEVGLLVQVRQAVGTNIEQAYVTYDYTPNGKQKFVVDANGNKAEFVYDGLDRQTQWRFPSKTGPTGFNPATPATALSTAGLANGNDYEQYAYDANGNRTGARKRDGRVICQRYDALNRADAKFYRPLGTAVATCESTSPSGADATYYGYDNRGLQLFARFGSTSGQGVANAYDGFGRLASSTTNMGGTSRTLVHQYDANGNHTRITHPDNQYFVYDYDGLDRVVGIKENGSSTAAITLTYDAQGRRSGLARHGAPATSYGYDGASRLVSLAHAIAAPNVLTLGFGYNPASQIVSRTISNDNYVFEDNVSVNRSYAANGLNQYTGAGPASLNYDDNGNLIYSSDPTLGTANYTYDIENRLLAASGAKTVNISYDPAGRLFETSGGSEGTTRFLYDGDALVAEYSSSGTLLRRYVHGPGVDEPLIWYEGSTVSSAHRRFLYANHQGSIVAVTGAITALKAYDPYGIPSTVAGQPLIRFQYTGQIFIPELDMYHYKARVYSPTLGRFMQTDPIGYEDQVNLYAYVGNDPVNKLDPQGERIVVAAHEVVLGTGTGKYHLKLIVLPNNQKAYRNDVRFLTNRAGARFATLGAGPENNRLTRPQGDLVSNINRVNDVNAGGVIIAELLPAKGETEDQLIARIFEADANYGDNAEYNFFPNEDGEHNSNSYLSGLLDFLGAEVTFPDPKDLPLPGAERPVPQECFAEPGGC